MSEETSPETSAATLGSMVRAARELSGMTIRDLAVLAGAHYSVLSRIESGHVARPSADIVHRLAEALGLDAVVLLGFIGVRLPDTATFLRHRYQLTDEDAAAVAEQVEAIVSNLTRVREERPR